MVAYRRVDDLTVTCRLTACTPGSARGPTLGVEYGQPLPLAFYVTVTLCIPYNVIVRDTAWLRVGVACRPVQDAAMMRWSAAAAADDDVQHHPGDVRASSPGLLAFIPFTAAQNAVSTHTCCHVTLAAICQSPP